MHELVGEERLKIFLSPVPGGENMFDYSYNVVSTSCQKILKTLYSGTQILETFKGERRKRPNIHNLVFFILTSMCLNFHDSCFCPYYDIYVWVHTIMQIVTKLDSKNKVSLIHPLKWNSSILYQKWPHGGSIQSVA